MSCNSRCVNPTNTRWPTDRWTALSRAALASVFVAAICLAYPHTAHAANEADTAAASAAERNGVSGNFALQGQGRLRFFGLHVYDAKLWSATAINTNNYATTPLALELIYGRSLYGKLIAERSLKEMQGVAAVSDAQAANWLDAMTQLFPDVKEGDRLTGVYKPGSNAVFWLNGKRLGEVADPAFAQAFFGIWLSANSSEPGLREQLLGKP